MDLPDLVETRELRYFVAVAEELHFGMAAQRLGIAQPPLSRAIRRLEHRLGVLLLVRTSRSVSLSPAGEVLLHDGRQALEAVAAATRRAQRTGRPGQTLVLAVKEGADAGLLPTLLAAYAATPDAWPVEVVFSAGERIAMLRDGRADLALLHRPNNDLSGLDHEDLLVEQQIVVLPPGHRLAGRADVALADLRGEVLPRGPEIAHRPWLPPGPDVRDAGQLLQMIARGRGVALLPASTIGRVPRELPCVPVRDAGPVALVLAWRAESTSRQVAAFAAAAAGVAAAPR